jgi:Mrp family chromosome partitioning ATPase
MDRMQDSLTRVRRKGEAARLRGNLPAISSMDGQLMPGRFCDPMTALYGSVRMLVDKGHTVLHFVSALSGEGASTVACDLAVMSGKRSHGRTLLIDGNAQNPALAAKFGCDPDQGVLDGLRQHRLLGESLMQVEDGADFWVGSLQSAVSIGGMPPNEVRRAYALFREQFDLTVIDCSSIAGGRYADLVPEAVDGVILVIQAEATRPAVVAHAYAIVERLGGNIVGAVLNRRKDYIPEFIYRYL